MIRRITTRVVATFVLALMVLPFSGGVAHAITDVAEPFRDYYAQHQGIKVLGYPITGVVAIQGYPAQYFEKGRIEDHHSDETNPAWVFAYGRLTAELMDRDPGGSFSSTNITYGDIKRAAGTQFRQAPPPGFTGGTRNVTDGVFVPFDSQLRPAPGYVVPPFFWSYINRADLFPGGWLHDVGLPMTGAFSAQVVKSGEQRQITLQGFERAVLTYDPRNPSEWQVERGNIGSDALRTLGDVGAAIEIPSAGATVTLPLHILARGGNAGDQVTATLRWADGVELSHTFNLLRGEDGRGLLITNLDWLTEGPPPVPATKQATLLIYDQSGNVLAQQPSLTVLPYDDPGLQEIKLYWYIDQDLIGIPHRIPRTTQIATATLQELLWGPTPGNLADFSTAIPTPQEVLNYPARKADWGQRVTLKKLTIVNGVATADFSKEIGAYGGGSGRVTAITEQITRTLKQFSSVSQVRILVEGQEDALQP